MTGMKVLAVTGRLAHDLVVKFAKGADVLALDVDVAAFITPEMLMGAAPKGYDLILVPGAITADFREAERKLGAKIRLGPKHAADLGFVLSHIDDVELSTSIPACVILESSMQKNALAEVDRLEAKASPVLQIKDVKIGGCSRMKVLAEVVDATRLRQEDLIKKIRYYEKQGADMIDLGLPLDARPSDVAQTFQIARKTTGLPLSVDTVRADLILAGLHAGADLVLSLDGRNLPVVGETVAAAGISAVVIPGPGTLEDNLMSARDLGIKIIADPVLDPPLQGLTRSIQRYTVFRETHPNIPLFFGAGNVTELLDADSQGANALLAVLAAEVGADILFTPEYSAKARGSVRELLRASQMMLLAKERRTPPKDLGIDLLVLKEKRPRPEDPMPQQFVASSHGHKYESDPAGSFRIGLAGGMILAKQGECVIAGCNARDILNTIIEKGLVSRLDHAGYLGRELEKAELALRLGRSYSQDKSLLLLRAESFEKS